VARTANSSRPLVSIAACVREAGDQHHLAVLLHGSARARASQCASAPPVDDPQRSYEMRPPVDLFCLLHQNKAPHRDAGAASVSPNALPCTPRQILQAQPAALSEAKVTSHP
jgi:hypothetical protein